MKKHSGSDFLHASGENWEDFQMVNPYTHEPIQTPEDFKAYVDEFFKEAEARTSHKVEVLEKEFAACRNENKRIKAELAACRSERDHLGKKMAEYHRMGEAAVSHARFRGWIIAVLCVVLFALWVIGRVYLEPAIEDQVEAAYQAGANDLSSSLELQWKRNGPDSCTLLREDFTETDFENFHIGTHWFDFCGPVDMPKMFIQFPLKRVTIKNGKDTYEFTFEDDRLTEAVKLQTAPSPSPKNDSGSQKSNSQKIAFPNDPSPTVEPGMAWVPTNGGKCYHRYETCSAMDEPEYVTIEEAQSRGFTPCGKCW